MADDFNMSMRKFLKQVGVTSQQAIERAAQEKGGGTYEVTARVTCPELGLDHEITGTIKGDPNTAPGEA